MAKFHFKMRDGSYVREAEFEIPESKLVPPAPDIFLKRFEDPRELEKYRQAVIAQHLQKWALRYTNPTWREIHHEQSQQGNADRIDQPPP